MAIRIRKTDERLLRYRAQRRAVWEFAAAVNDWRCTVCFSRVDYEDRELFERTNLCPACSSAINDASTWVSEQQHLD